MRWTVAAASLALVLVACSGGSTTSSSGQPTGQSTVAIGPIPVAAGQETTVCIVVPFGNTEDVVVNSPAMAQSLDLCIDGHCRNRAQ